MRPNKKGFSVILLIILVTVAGLAVLLFIESEKITAISDKDNSKNSLNSGTARINLSDLSQSETIKLVDEDLNYIKNTHKSNKDSFAFVSYPLIETPGNLYNHSQGKLDLISSEVTGSLLGIYNEEFVFYKFVGSNSHSNYNTLSFYTIDKDGALKSIFDSNLSCIPDWASGVDCYSLKHEQYENNFFLLLNNPKNIETQKDDLGIFLVDVKNKTLKQIADTNDDNAHPEMKVRDGTLYIVDYSYDNFQTIISKYNKDYEIITKLNENSSEFISKPISWEVYEGNIYIWERNSKLHEVKKDRSTWKVHYYKNSTFEQDYSDAGFYISQNGLLTYAYSSVFVEVNKFDSQYNIYKIVSNNLEKITSIESSNLYTPVFVENGKSLGVVTIESVTDSKTKHVNYLNLNSLNKYRLLSNVANLLPVTNQHNKFVVNDWLNYQTYIFDINIEGIPKPTIYITHSDKSSINEVISSNGKIYYIYLNAIYKIIE